MKRLMLFFRRLPRETQRNQRNVVLFCGEKFMINFVYRACFFIERKVFLHMLQGFFAHGNGLFRVCKIRLCRFCQSFAIASRNDCSCAFCDKFLVSTRITCHNSGFGSLSVKRCKPETFVSRWGNVKRYAPKRDAFQILLVRLLLRSSI